MKSTTIALAMISLLLSSCTNEESPTDDTAVALPALPISVTPARELNLPPKPIMALKDTLLVGNVDQFRGYLAHQLVSFEVPRGVRAYDYITPQLFILCEEEEYFERTRKRPNDYTEMLRLALEYGMLDPTPLAESAYIRGNVPLFADCVSYGAQISENSRLAAARFSPEIHSILERSSELVRERRIRDLSKSAEVEGSLEQFGVHFFKLLQSDNRPALLAYAPTQEELESINEGSEFGWVRSRGPDRVQHELREGLLYLKEQVSLESATLMCVQYVPEVEEPQNGHLQLTLEYQGGEYTIICGTFAVSSGRTILYDITVRKGNGDEPKRQEGAREQDGTPPPSTPSTRPVRHIW